MANATEPYWVYLGNVSTVPPPPGVVPNFVDPVSLQRYDVLTQSVCLSVATVFVLMRLYTKVVVLRNPWWDDCESKELPFREIAG